MIKQHPSIPVLPPPAQLPLLLPPFNPVLLISPIGEMRASLFSLQFGVFPICFSMFDLFYHHDDSFFFLPCTGAGGGGRKFSFAFPAFRRSDFPSARDPPLFRPRSPASRTPRLMDYSCTFFHFPAPGAASFLRVAASRMFCFPLLSQQAVKDVFFSTFWIFFPSGHGAISSHALRWFPFCRDDFIFFFPASARHPLFVKTNGTGCLPLSFHLGGLTRFFSAGLLFFPS